MTRAEAFDEYYKVAAFVQAYDGYFLAIKTWGVTVTAGAIAVGFSAAVTASRVAQMAVFSVACLLACAFWMSETLFKMLQQAHIGRVVELERSLNEGAQEIGGPAYLSSFSAFRRIDRETRRWRSVLFWPHVMLPHAVFAAVSMCLILFAALKSWG